MTLHANNRGAWADLGSQHGSVRRGLVTISLDLHATGDTHHRFLARQIRNVDEGVVERGEDVANAENNLTLADGVRERCRVFFDLLDYLLRRLQPSR